LRGRPVTGKFVFKNLAKKKPQNFISLLCFGAKFWREQGAGSATGDTLSPGVILPVLAGWFRAIAVLLPPRSALALSTPLLLSSLTAAIRRKFFFCFRRWNSSDFGCAYFKKQRKF